MDASPISPRGVFTPTFPSSPPSSVYDPELESLCRLAAWIGAHKGSEAPLTFRALLAAFLVGKDPVSVWFQHYARSAHVDVEALFAEERMTETSLGDLHERAARNELPENQPLFSRSMINVFGEADQIAKSVGAPSAQPPGSSPPDMS